MKFCLYTISISPHQIPLAEELVKLLGADEYRYVYIRDMSKDRRQLGWSARRPDWMIPAESEEAQRWLREADVVMAGERNVDLFKERSRRGLKTLYCSERWFKPLKWGLDGRLRMLSPSYRSRARAIMDLVRTDVNFVLYPIGIHAARDFAWLLGCRISDFEHIPGGLLRGEGRYLEKMRMWGYFVAPSRQPDDKSAHSVSMSVAQRPLRVLWVGRMLHLKRVDTIIRAVAHICRGGGAIQLTLVGDGPEKRRLQVLARKLDLAVTFMPPVPIGQIRDLMRRHDVYVLSSNAYEGWGAVVSEAIEEGMAVLGTQEAGSTATILDRTRLFPAGDVQSLASCLMSIDTAGQSGGSWSARAAAETIARECFLL